MSNYCIVASAVVEKVGAEMVILNMNDGHYYGLDEIGTRMLELVVEYGDIDKVVEGLLEEYESTAETLRHDLVELLGQLEQHGLVAQASR